jgi:hypothetical protein
MIEGSKVMDCFQFEQLVHDLGRRRGLNPDVRDEALAHAESCERCAQLLTDVERLDSALRLVAADQRAERPGDLARSRIETALMAEFRAVKKGATRRNVAWQAAAVAAVAIVLFTTGWALRHFAPASIETRPGVEGNGGAGGSSPAASPQQTYAVVAENESENGARFIRLPSAGDGSAMEDDAIVRAVLPRSALASLGFPVGDLSSTEAVPVELVVSEDGTPEAIRLVSQDIEE